MPSNREVMRELGVGPVTVRRAVAQLVAEGLLTTRPGSGTFVSRATSRVAPDTDWQHVTLGASPVDPAGLDMLIRLRDVDAMQLASGYPEAAARVDGRIAAAMARAARRPEAWSAPPSAGIPELRAWFAMEIGVGQEDVLITPGCQAAISATMRALLPAGSPVLFATPTYPGALAVARSAGLVPIGVPCDRDGVRTDLLERAFATTGARLLYLQPTFNNPDGHVLAAERRAEVLGAASAAGAFVLEDDWARWLGHGATPPPPLIRDDGEGHVITITSLTKSAAPSLRVGALAARGPVWHRVGAMRLVDDFFVSRPLQEAAVELVTAAGWQSHLRALSAALRQRLEALRGSLARHLAECSYETPSGGVCLWLELPRGTDEDAVVDRALALGVAVTPGRIYAIGESETSHIRLSFGSIDSSAVDSAVRLLSGAVRGA
jgi:DNA-binding transcriptional MocR family regulator